MNNTELKIDCPICANRNNIELGSRIYNSNDSHWEGELTKIQKHIFFNIWNNRKETVELHRFLCQKCGFITDLPRPDEDAIDNKYKYLAKESFRVGIKSSFSDKVLREEYKQASDALKLMVKYLGKKKRSLNILDFGGATGHFLIPMKERGHNCFLVDYDKNPLSGIIRLGDSLNDIPPHFEFDIIICRHVLEHVAAPSNILNEFRKFLREDGVIYSEVPIEIWKAISPNIDPVTHINFFHEKSIRILFQVLGYDVVMSREKRTTYRGHSMLVAQTVAITRTLSKKIDYKSSYRKTKNLIHPNFLQVFFYYKHRPLYMIKLMLERIFRFK